MSEAWCGRLRATWSIRNREGFTGAWPINANGLPELSLAWGRARPRSIATLWVSATFGERDIRPARIAYETGPLPEFGVRWHVTWHTWDRNGTGGENAGEFDLASAIEAALYRCLVQRFIPSLNSSEAEGVLRAAHLLSASWRRERGLLGLRWNDYPEPDLGRTVSVLSEPPCPK